MNPEVFHEYETAVMLLKSDLTEWFPGAAVTSTTADVPIYPDYNQRDDQLITGNVAVSMVVVTNVARTSTVAFVPVALFERGDIMASLAPAGPLAEGLRRQILEVLALRKREPGDVWVCLGAHP